jgi:hypothetical protein
MCIGLQGEKLTKRFLYNYIKLKKTGAVVLKKINLLTWNYPGQEATNQKLLSHSYKIFIILACIYRQVM